MDNKKLYSKQNAISILKKPIKILYKFFCYSINRILLFTKKVNYDKTLNVNGILNIFGSGKDINIGKNVTINSGKRANPIGGDGRTILRGKIFIGDNSGISNTTIVSNVGVKIGSDVLIGGSTKIYDTDFHSLEYEKRMEKPDVNIKSAPIEICDGAFIGAHTIILKGVRIGKKSIVGAGSVVAKSIPDEEIWAGNPAKFIRKIN